MKKHDIGIIIGAVCVIAIVIFFGWRLMCKSSGNVPVDVEWEESVSGGVTHTPRPMNTPVPKPGVGDLPVADVTVTPVPTKKPVVQDVEEPVETPSVVDTPDGNLDEGVECYTRVNWSGGTLATEDYTVLVNVAVELYKQTLQNEGKDYEVTWRNLDDTEKAKTGLYTYYDVLQDGVVFNVVVRKKHMKVGTVNEEVKSLKLRYERDKLILCE